MSYSFGSGIPTYNGIPMIGGIPVVAGNYYHVNPRIGKDGNRGISSKRPLDSFVKAEDVCKTDVGDGIIVWSQGNTSANTTSYLTSAMAFDKSGLTVFGVASGSMFYGRARLAASAASDLAYLVDVSGSNNCFYNLHMANYGDANTALGCLRVTGHRNLFVNCHLSGAGHATPGAVAHAAGSSYGAHDLMLSGSENTFVNCTFGTNSIIRAGNNANIVIGGQQSKNHFIGCRTLSYSATSGHGCVALYASNVLNGWVTFEDCIFTNWNPGAVTSHTSWLIGATPSNCGILLKDPGMIGWNLWDSATGNDVVYITGAAGHATGGKGIVAS